MNKPITLTVAGAGLVLLVLSFFLGTKLQENRSLHQQNRQFIESTRLLQNQLTALEGRTNELTSRLVEMTESNRAVVATASNTVEALAAQQAQTKDEAAPSHTVMPRAYQLPVYVGQKHLGLAWVVPMNVQKDAASGRVTCEHFIQLPETARDSFTTYVTNLVEQPVFMPPQVIERSVYVDRGYNWVWSHRGGGGHRPVDPEFGVPPTAAPPSPLPPSGIYRPPRPGNPGIYVPPGIK